MLHNSLVRRELLLSMNKEPLVLQRRDVHRSVARRPGAKAVPVTELVEPLQASTASASGGGEWYIVKDNDNLWKIAAEQLGSGNAWQQIRDLNKDVLKGGDTVQINMRLRIPPKPVASAN